MPALAGSCVTALHTVKALECCGQVGKAYAGPREALRLTAKFVLAQLLLASGGAEAAARVASLPFVTALQAEVRGRISLQICILSGITIGDDGCVCETPIPDASRAGEGHGAPGSPYC